MGQIPTPFDVMRLSMQMGFMLAEAQMVIAMRVWGMAGVWDVTPGEKTRMFHEKVQAAQSASLALTRAMMTGAGPAAMASAALKPVSSRTASNVRRLMKRGPSKP